MTPADRMSSRDRRLRATVEDLARLETELAADLEWRESAPGRFARLAWNEGQFPPLPEAIAAIERGARTAHRYPDGDCTALRGTLAERLGVTAEQVVVAAGSDAVILYLSIAALDPGDEIVLGWPSFPIYALSALKAGGVVRRVPLRDHRYDLDAILAAVTARTKLVYVCNPNNPTGTMVGRAELAAYFERVPPHVITVLDQAYFEYVEDPDYPDGIAEHVKEGRRALVLRTFSKIYGLAALRVGYAVGPVEVVEAVRSVQSAYDVTQAGQEAALASLGNEQELTHRRLANAQGRARIELALRDAGLRVADRPVGNFVYAEVGDGTGALIDRLRAEGAFVRPLGAFGAPEAMRVSVGTPAENELFARALRLAGAPEAARGGKA